VIEAVRLWEVDEEVFQVFQVGGRCDPGVAEEVDTFLSREVRLGGACSGGWKFFLLRSQIKRPLLNWSDPPPELDQAQWQSWMCWSKTELRVEQFPRRCR